MNLSPVLVPLRHPITRRVRMIVRRTIIVMAVILAVALVTTLSIDVGPLLKSVAEQQGSKYIERPMHIGRMEARLWDGAFIFHDFRIDGLTPDETPFLTAKRIVVSMPWSTLFDRRVVFDSIEMSDWQMYVENLPDGRHNFPRFTRERKGPRSVWTTTLQYVRAYRGEFTYQDFGTPWGIVARNLDVTVTKLGTDYRGTARFANGLVAIQNYLPFRTDMTSNFKIDGGRVIFGRIDLATEGTKSVMNGDVNLSFWPELMIHVKSTIDFPKMREIFFAGDSFSLDGTSQFDGTFHLFKETQVAGQPPRTGRELKGEFQSPLAGINKYRFSNLRGSVRWTPELLEVTDATAGAYGGTSQFMYRMAPLNAKGVVPTATFDARYENVDLTSISDLFELNGIRFAGRASGRNLLEWPLRRYAEHTGMGYVSATPPGGQTVMTREMPLARIAAREARRQAFGPFSPLTPFEPVPVGGEITYAYGPEWIDISNAQLATNSTYVEMQGRTKYGPESRFPFHVSSADWQDSDRLFAGILTAFGSKTGAIPIGGYGTFDGLMTGDFRSPRIEGDFAGERIKAWNVVWGSVRGAAVIENSYADVKDVVITSGESTIKTTGRYSLGFPRKDGGEQINARIEISKRPAADLRHAFNIDDYQVDGLLSGEFQIAGEYLRPNGTGRMEIVNGVAYGEPFDSATANVRLEGEGARMQQVVVQKSGGRGTGNAYIGWNGTYSFTFNAQGIPVESVAAAKRLQMPLAGTLKFDANGSGSFESPRYDVSGSLTDLFVGDEGIGQVNARLGVDNDVMSLEMDAASSRLQVHGVGRIALNDQKDAQLTFNVLDTSLDPYVRLALPRLSPFTTAVVTGSVNVTGELNDIDHLLVDATVDKLDMRLFDYALHNARPIRVALDNHTVDIKDMRLEGQETQLDVTGRANLHDETIAIKANGDANLAVLQGFFSNIRSTGSAKLAATLQGPLRDPAANGMLTIENGRIRSFALPHALESINGSLQFDSEGVTLDGLTAQLAKGDVRFAGRIDKNGYLPGRFDVTMNGTDMQLRFPPGMRSSLVDATLSLRGSMEDATLQGLVNVKDALYTQPIATGGGLFDFTGGGQENQLPDVGLATTIPLRYDIRIVAPSTLQIKNNTLRIVADAELRLVGSFDRPVMLGRIEVKRGDALIEGKQFVITRGTIDFNNPTKTDPFFDIEAEARIPVPGETYRVTLRAAGPRDRLNSLALTSDPPLPEAEIIALVFSDIAPSGNVEFAQYNRNLTPQQRLAQDQAARALTGLLGASEVSRVAEKTFGIDTVRITPSLTDPTTQSARLEPGARVTVFKRMTDRVSLMYSRSLTSSSNSDQIIVLQYDQTDQFSWIVSRNEDGTYALDWQVRKSF
ncbi:MAG TPA: translocation/assembly module TamB domain-containing protein [Vicinamibacterales bacterium]|nr:translocation/assembly module TamB domain-containing protein [Vicinamibacterales bacterium]